MVVLRSWAARRWYVLTAAALAALLAAGLLGAAPGFNLYGAGNASAWGDYMVTQPYNPAVGPFLTTEWYVNSNAAVVPEVVVWGRGRDANGYNRWKSS